MKFVVAAFVVCVLFVATASAGGYNVTAGQFKCLFPRVSDAKIAAWLPELNAVQVAFAINNYNRVIMFLAQTGMETDHYNTFTEYTNSSGQNPWCYRYDGGCRYLGRGAIQLTGRYNYQQCGNYFGVDFVSNPTLVATNQWAFRTAGWFWMSHDLNKYSDAKDILGATKVINGGTNGLAAREKIYAEAQACIPSGPAPPAPNPPPAQSGCRTYYTVVSGDTLSAIAARFNTTVAKICAANGISNPNFIQVGQRLCIPY